MLDDPSISALHAALRGLSARQRAVSDDIANVNTPFFRARRVAFEGDLQQALANGDNPLATSAPTASFTDDPMGLNGNNVDLDAETILGVETEMRYELALRATGDRFSLLRTAIKGS
jgi:flagellar basal-body rod protein FlgB